VDDKGEIVVRVGETIVDERLMAKSTLLKSVRGATESGRIEIENVE
jgi:hypothetical protein